MHTAQVDTFVEMFEHMNRAKSGKYFAPHKPILLLSVMTLIEQGRITENKIELNRQLEDAFRWQWYTLVDNGIRQHDIAICSGLDIGVGNNYPFKRNIANPFFHLSNEPFWNLVPSAEWKARKEYSLSQLKREFLYAELLPDLFDLMLDKDMREHLRICLEGMV